MKNNDCRCDGVEQCTCTAEDMCYKEILKLAICEPCISQSQPLHYNPMVRAQYLNQFVHGQEATN